ncbi:MAG TPA: aspartate carbamoyltransferase [Caldisericia bacterium]|jgi:aspartate carbamoyltransferase catalytic subunit|nr:aspartate carbamoyltransferase [Caldisericia bacterium]HPO28983.1 aspartate carbamoyltransferase [Caldisericia bacterium]HXK70631.1 aspartate carbamoyltransferase [Caldisericia bacterium]
MEKPAFSKDLTNIKDLSNDNIEYIFNISEEMLQSIVNRDKLNICNGKILATLFYEPSTRTRLSFESAMIRLGGSVIGFSGIESSSVSKGESLSDTIRTVASYSDIIAIRHPSEGAARVAAEYSKVPVINAGDGGHQHPTQTLLDLFTIKKKKDTIKSLNIMLAGDLKFGRTTHSLALALARFGVNLFFSSPPGLEMPDYIIRTLKEEYAINSYISNDIRDYINEVDVIYMTRVQRERLVEAEYLKYRGSYILTKEILREMKKDAIIMHPLPRVDEISKDVDLDSRAVYFEQAFFGVPVRMALISILLGVK